MPHSPLSWDRLSGYQVRQFILKALGCSSQELGRVAPSINLFFLAFSAGCVGAVTAARHWYALGGRVGVLLAVDGWGVGLAEPFPAYRLSHDLFTHQTSKFLGGGSASFYADPPVAHLDIWRSPSRVQGWQVQSRGAASLAAPTKIPATAAGFIWAQLEQALTSNSETSQ